MSQQERDLQKYGQQTPMEILDPALKSEPGKNSSNDDFLNLDIPDFDQPEGETVDAIDGIPAPEFIGSDVFFEMHFKGVFAVSNMGFVLATRQEPLASLTAATELEGARQASDACYEIIVDTPSLHFLIKPQSIWFQRIIAIGGFGYVVAMTTAAEISSRREIPADTPSQNSSEEAATETEEVDEFLGEPVGPASD